MATKKTSKKLRRATKLGAVKPLATTHPARKD